MREKIKRETAKLLADRRRRRIWKRMVSALACAVVFCTVYALILPAITLEKTPSCGKPEHTHSASCYARATSQNETVPVCTPESLGLHSHTDACMNESGEYCCGYSDFIAHGHNDDCFDADGNLRCLLPEVEAHTHDESCYAQMETGPVHTHTDECYLTERGELICQAEESAGHLHTDECYNLSKVLVCELSDGAAERELICGKDQILEHVHRPDCFPSVGEVLNEASGEASGETSGEAAGEVSGEITGDASGETAGEALGETVGETSGEVPDKGVICCGLEEHTHSAACVVIGLINDLPDRQTVEARMAALAESRDKAEEAYLDGLQTQVREACAAYGALPEEEKAKVTNLERLTGLEWLQNISLQENTVMTVTNEDNSSAGAVPWTGNTDSARERLQAALFSVDQGYTIQSVQYYQITNLTGSRAAVSYESGGLSGGDTDTRIFVYDLGADGAGVPRSCAVESPVQEGGLFKSFSFEIPEGSESTAHICAFISAAPSTLAEMGIYLGAEQEDGSWVACDAASEEEAGVKAIVTLPEGAAAPEGYRLFVRRINVGEGFYPNDGAVRVKAGRFNGWQCYTIRWIRQDTDGSLHMLPLNEVGTTTVRIEYLKEEAKLPGPAGARKLLIYNSNTDGSLVDQVADSVENVRVDDNGYISFTFRAAQAGPYVFVSKTLEKGFVDALSIEKVVDGSEPFDKTDEAGNDSSAGNRIVRSYDTIQYNLSATFAARQAGVTADKINMYFELTLKKSATAARFDVSKMLWLGDNYSIEYLDDSGNVIMILAHDGKYYLPRLDDNGNVRRDDNGFALADTDSSVSMNAQVNGSTAGENSYKVSSDDPGISGNIAIQRLVGCTALDAKPGENILAGTQTFATAVEVRNADNGESFAPTFKIWLEGNEDNYGSEGQEGDVMLPAVPDRGNVIDVDQPEYEQYRVTVSAGKNFNIQLKKNTDMSYKNWFDFFTGNLVAEPDRGELTRLAVLPENHGKSNPAEFTENGIALPADQQARYANYRYGRITCYGITLQLYNDTDNDPSANRAAKGLKGLSLPVGDITFDLNFSSTVTSGGSTLASDEYTAILWDYNENVPADTAYSYHYVDPGRGTVTTPDDGRGNGGRNLYWDGETRSPYAKGGAPSNYIAYHGGCYYGGDWALTDENGQKTDSLEAINRIANPTVVTGSGGGTTYHFSVSDYDFDFDNRHFPLKDAGNSGNVTGYDTYARCFSAGCVQVLSVFPMVQEESEAEIFLNSTVSNLRLTTRAGQVLEAEEGDDTRIRHEVNTRDNTYRDQIVVYAPGGLTKGNAFNGVYRGREPRTTSEGYLGTEYWTTSYDCSTFAGDEIWIMSYGMMAAGGDYRTRSMNLLQLFDSRAFSIRGEPILYQSWDPAFDKKGETTFLYAADKDYPNGYDTNHQDANGEYDVLAYMNSVREEDLIYFTGLEALENAGYTCIGVLLELRGCDLLGGKYEYMSIPVKVNGDDEDLVGKTVATVNGLRIWSEDLGDITWADGEWNDTVGKNELPGFPHPTNTIEDNRYSGQLANGGKSPPAYVKTEYADGLQVKGTHAGGTLAGNSLLILGYKAEIDIEVDNKGQSSMISYNLGNGETVVDYRLTNIKTVISDLTGQTKKPTTTLTIKAVLDENNPTDNQRISVAGGSYRITGYAVDAEGNAAGEETGIAIGSDPSHPTELEFTAPEDGQRYRVKIYVQMGEGNQSVSFVIQNAPVGLQLPDITFQANFAAVTFLNDNDTIKTGAYISGQGDNRAYDQAKGNTDNVTVGVVMGSGTNLTKAVDTRYIELNDVITYTVIYTNSGTERINKIYFYDLIPYDHDIRGSMFEGKVVLRDVRVFSSKEDGVPPADATVYYSTTDYWEVYNTVKEFGGMRESAVEEMLENGRNQKGDLLFRPLAAVSGDSFSYDAAFNGMSGDEITALMSTVKGLYVKVENLQKGQTVTMQITVQTKDNAAGNWYKNIANSWIAGSQTVPLTSNKVETQVVSRSISGVVWHDRNLNGLRDDNERLLKDVTVTLFKKEKTEYELCTEDVAGGRISPVTTGPDGAYSFDRLGAGDYIVAFSGDSLAEFIGATIYQQNGKNDANTNDGKAVVSGKDKSVNSAGYVYYIRYSVGAAEMPLHRIEDMGSVNLVNGAEMYVNQDLGLITAGYELPATGGTGNAPYITGGILILCAGLIQLYSKTARKDNSIKERKSRI